LTGLPLIPLDRYYWKPGWVESEKDEWKSTVEKLVAGDEWIIDGNYGGTMEMRLNRADTVIWLDMPRFLCTYRVLKRTFLFRKRGRPDMPDGCDERFDWDFMKYVWNFPRDKNPLLEKRLERLGNQIEAHKFRQNSSVTGFLNRIRDEI